MCGLLAGRFEDSGDRLVDEVGVVGVVGCELNVSPGSSSADGVTGVDAPSGEDASGVAIASVSGAESLVGDPCADVVMYLFDVEFVSNSVNRFDDLGESFSRCANVSRSAGGVDALGLAASDVPVRVDA